MRIIVVTGGTEDSATQIADLAASLRRCLADLRFATGCFDCGFAPETARGLTARFDKIVKPQWPFRPHPKFANDPAARAAVAPAFLPDHLPGFDAYIWIDPGTFVQSVTALELLSRACRGNAAAVVPILDRSYNLTLEHAKSQFEHYRMAFGANGAHRLLQMPHLAANVIAASGASPLWQLWRSRFQALLDRWDGATLSKLAVINQIFNLEQLPHHRLPATCNWQSHLALPMVDLQRRCLVEPNYPFERLDIVTNLTPAPAPTLKSLNGDMLECALTFEGVVSAISAHRTRAPAPQ